MPTYRVRDQLHVSALGADTMPKGHEFAASKALGDDLVKRELVDLVQDDPAEDAPAAKAEAAPENKAIAAPPANKASPKGKGRAKA